MVLNLARLLPAYGQSYAASIVSLLAGRTATWLRLTGTSSDIASNAAYSGGVGAELLTNGDFIAWTADDPDDWTVTEVGDATSNITENPADTLNLISDGTVTYARQTILTVGDTFRHAVDVAAINSGSFRLRHSGGAPYKTVSAPGVDTGDFIAASQWWDILHSVGGSDVEINSASVKKVGELDAQLSNVTVNQTGFFGAGEAVSLNGTTSYGTITNTGLDGMTDFTFMFLLNLDTLSDDDTLLFKNAEFDVFFNAAGSIDATVYFDTTNAHTTTPVGTLTTGAWYWVTVVMDSSDNKVHVYVNDTLADDVVTAGVGTRVSNTNPVYLWNDSGAANALDGLCDEVIGIEDYALPV